MGATRTVTPSGALTASSLGHALRVSGLERLPPNLGPWVAGISFPLLLLASGLAAYNVRGIPIQWLASVGFVALAAVVLVVERDRGWVLKLPGLLPLVLFLCWASVVTLLNAVRTDFASLMPPGATTPYPVFVLLRFMNVAAFVATCAVVTLMIQRGAGRRVVAATVLAGAGLGAFALYVYVAHSLGLPEPPRTRMGTGGGAQLTTFSMAGFYLQRALGTFREPGHLAEWLVVPFFVSLSLPSWRYRVASVVIGTALLLTVSMTGLGGSALGAMAALLLLRPRQRVVFQLAGSLSPLVVAAIITAYASYASGAVLFGTTRASVLEVLATRAPQILVGGAEFNRGYVYDGIRERGLPIVGSGLGQASIAYSGNLVVSFLSLYVNTAYSVGLIGLGLLVLFLVVPVYLAAKRSASRDSVIAQCAGMAYFSWLVMYAFGSEELTVMSAVAYALLACGYLPDQSPASHARAASSEGALP